MRQSITTYILCLIFILAAAYVQANSFLNTDSSWLVDSARKLLAGENLYTDYVETNPPFIVYLTALALMLGISYKLFAFIILSASLLLSLKYIRSDFLKIIITYGLFILPAQSFGQREHLFIAFVLPYFLCLMAENKPRLIDVIFAGFGLILKPYFAIFFIGFALWQKFVLKRPLLLAENFIIALMMVLYVTLIYFLEHDYFDNTLPLLLKYYGQFYYEKIPPYITGLVFLLLVIALFTFVEGSVIFRREICFAAFAAFLGGLTLLLQNKGWTNHYLPLYFFLLIAIGLLMERTEKLLQLLLGLIFTGMVAHGSYVNSMLICPENKYETQQIITILDKEANGKAALPVGFDLSVLYPEILYSHAKFTWQYPQLWMLIGMYGKNDIKHEQVIHHKPPMQNPDEAKIFNSFVNYVADAKPAVIAIVDERVNTKKLGDFKFGFIKYFSQSSKFAEAFKNYRLIRRMDGREIYVLDHEAAATNIPQR